MSGISYEEYDKDFFSILDKSHFFFVLISNLMFLLLFSEYEVSIRTHSWNVRFILGIFLNVRLLFMYNFWNVGFIFGIFTRTIYRL